MVFFNVKVGRVISRNRRRRGYRWLRNPASGLAALSLLLTACAGNGAPASDEEAAGSTDDQADVGDSGEYVPEDTFEVVVPYPPAPSFAAETYLNHKGASKDLINVENANGAPQAMQQVAAGNADVAMVSSTDVINALDEGFDVITIGTKRAPLPFSLISSADNPITNMDQLKGCTVGVISVGGSTDMMLDLMLLKEGMSPDDITDRVVTKSTPGTLEAVDSGELCAFVGTSDTAAEMKSIGSPAEYFDPNDLISIPGQVIVADPKAVEEDPEKFTWFLVQFAETFDSLIADADNDWVEMIALFKEIGADQGDDEAVAAKLDDQLAAWLDGRDRMSFENDPDAWAETIDGMVELELISPGSSVDDFITDEVLP